MKAEDFTTEAGTPTLFIQFKGIWDMQDVYATIADFLRRQKFKLHEKMQRHRAPSPFGAERQYLFEAERDTEDYYKWIVEVNIETFDEHEVEVVTKEGVKKTMTKGRMWVRVSGRVETDYDKMWEKTAFLAQLRNFYNKYVIRKTWEGVLWDEMYYNIVQKLHTVIKERLKMLSEGYEHRHFSRVH
ncbi:hypothetical protein HYU10_04700 [Candidatus Woesearchaeota archaeon]|nr:hypothetical protein [Candidatus Woesearchaeota archaeon]MBI2661167.1 hypothetical protein [Candidatus Woesearchaeota archaeon]